MRWAVPRLRDVGGGGGSTGGEGRDPGWPRAARCYEASEVVDRSLCIALGPGDLRGCFLEAYCYSFPVGAPPPGNLVRLLPVGGWGLLFGHGCSDGNLTVEYECAPPPRGPLRDADGGEGDGDGDDGGRCSPGGGPGSAGGGTTAPRPWLVFRAARRLVAGEALTVARSPHLALGAVGGASLSPPPVFSAAVRAAGGAGSLRLRQPSAVEEQYVLSEVPRSLRRRTEAPGALAGASALHGAGAFAARGRERGELVEHVPMLPVIYSEVCHSELRDYVFAGDFLDDAAAARFVVLPLGLGGLYNHSDSAPNIYARRYLHEPFLQAWTAQRDVAAGEEMLVSYGEAYWKAPWRKPPQDVPDSSRRSSGERAWWPWGSWFASEPRDDDADGDGDGDGDDGDGDCVSESDRDGDSTGDGSDSSSDAAS
mmetsp:Transcript_103762/g.292010  ORF Transcript_103762/g.292010 Transcript_103762/m.292010 type:complete len:424 (+) Transcript_103762:123-1394(+)